MQQPRSYFFAILATILFIIAIVLGMIGYLNKDQPEEGDSYRGLLMVAGAFAILALICLVVQLRS
ncbi:MAG: hypothetical protein IJT34_00520 [Butyrivibrio sp.]|nr:hypothetical protein [Butyrivibrio sp.]